jgi:hypothetical protein
MVLAGMVRNRGADLGRRLAASAAAANEDIFQDYHENGGATLSAVAATARGEVLGMNVGDSRIYRRVGGLMAAMTLDDNIGSQLHLLGKGDAAGGALGKQLTQFLGIGRGLEPKIIHDIGGTEATHFLTTDGIHGLGEKILSEVAVSAPNLVETARRITMVAKWCKGSDNGTIVGIAPDLVKIARSPVREPLEMVEVWDSFGSLSIAGDRLLYWHGSGGVAPAKRELAFHGGGSETNYAKGLKSGSAGVAPAKPDLAFYGGGSEEKTNYAKGWQKKGGAKKRIRKHPASGTAQPQPDVQITEEPTS